MSSVGFALLLVAVGPSADPLALVGPQLTRGDELVYSGDILETSELVGNRYKKRYELEVRVFVIDARRAYADCGVLTVVRPLGDPLVAAARQAVKVDAPPNKAVAAVRLELIRVDDRGRVKRLAPKVGPPPLLLNTDTPTADPPALPTDAPPPVELGAFLPLPVGAAKVGSTWDVTEPNRPPVVWTAKGDAVWSGRRCVEATATQQTDGYDRPDVHAGWKRTETVLVSPTDGFTSAVTRTIARREGRDVVGTITVKYELQPSNKWVGAKYQDARAEVEAAWVFAAEYADGVARKARPDEAHARLKEIERYLDTRPAATSYRAAVEAVKRRYEAGVAAAPPVTAKKIVITPVEVDAPRVGQPAPDFAAADVDKPTGRVRLSAARGKPVVLAFFKPGSETSADTLAVCEALHRKYAGAVTVIPLAVHGTAADAAKQRTELKATVPVYDGDEVKATYAIESVPRFLVIDGKGTLRWVFDAGIGPEVGYLVKQEVEKVK